MCVLMWLSEILSNSYCFEIQGHLFTSLRDWLSNYKVKLNVLPLPFVLVHIIGQGVRLIPKLLRSLRFVLKGKTPLNRDILVACDILECFLELLQCFHVTVISGSVVLK